MRWWIVVVAIGVTGCCTPAALGEVSGGVVHPVGAGRSENGVCVQEMIGIGDCHSGTVAGAGVRYRHTGETSELAWSVHEGATAGLGHGVAVFGRVSLNLLEWDRIGTDDELGALGESVEIGVGKDDDTGLCVIGSASHDVRLRYDDELFVGLNVGLCGISTP